MDELANQVGVEFKPYDTKVFGHEYRMGNNEKMILDIIEQEKNIKLHRQFQVGRKSVDGYDKNTNTVYEVDEWHHKYDKIYDSIREEEIKDVLGCKFIRIDEKDFLQNIGQKTLLEVEQ